MVECKIDLNGNPNAEMMGESCGTEVINNNDKEIL